MLTDPARQRILDRLERDLGIQDVYFWRDRLVVINEYDLALVQNLVDAMPEGSDLSMIVCGDTLDHWVN